MSPGSLGRLLLVTAAVLALVGAALVASERFPGLRLGRLPGDLVIERERFKIWLPLGTSLVLSVLLSLVLWLLSRRG